MEPTPICIFFMLEHLTHFWQFYHKTKPLCISTHSSSGLVTVTSILIRLPGIPSENGSPVLAAFSRRTYYSRLPDKHDVSLLPHLITGTQLWERAVSSPKLIYLILCISNYHGYLLHELNPLLFLLFLNWLEIGCFGSFRLELVCV